MNLFLFVFILLFGFGYGCATTSEKVVTEEEKIFEVDSLFTVPVGEGIKVEFVLLGVGTAEVRVDSVKVTVYE